MSTMDQIENPDPDDSKEELDESNDLPVSPVLARLIEEVRNEKVEILGAYNRFHNRHNRSR